MITGLSQWLVRYRRALVGGTVSLSVLLTAIAASAESAGAPVAVIDAILAGSAVLVLSLIGFTEPGRVREFTLERRDGELRTRSSGFPVAFGLLLITMANLLAGLGVRESTHVRFDPAWAALVAFFGGGVFFFLRSLWYGSGVTLTPDGLVTERKLGTVTVPWEALRGVHRPGETGAVTLSFARPELVTTTGVVFRKDRVEAELIRPQPLAVAIRHFVDRPAERDSIGTEAGYERLRAAVEPRPVTEPAGEPPSLRAVVGNLAGGVALFLGAVVGESWAEDALGAHSFWGSAANLLLAFAIIGGGMIMAGVKGARSRRAGRRSTS
ncbi:hypothetical protein [Actinoplanes sp. NPDC051851]|uniref:PH domain-containing protein n=1 Tax=Actinoplanes sp. NPDC051851 TaxID=3154753 RepID=UPI0034152A5E